MQATRRPEGQTNKERGPIESLPESGAKALEVLRAHRSHGGARTYPLAAAAMAAVPALAANSGNVATQTSQNSSVNSSHKGEVQSLLKSATAEVRTMKQNPQLKRWLAKTKGVYLVPEFGAAR